MAGYRRQSTAEMEVQEYLAKARAGLAGVNPKAQTLARSGGNPQAQQYGQELVARQLQENAARREAVAAERARAEEQRRQEELRVRELKRQEESRARAEREAKLQKWADENGALTHRDPQTGRLDVKRHADGKDFVFKPGPVGEPWMEPRIVHDRGFEHPADPSQMIPTWLPLGDDGGVLGATTFADRKVEEEWHQAHRDDRGNITKLKLEKKTDPRTAETYYEKPSKIEGQAPERVVTGIDRRVKRMQELDRDADALGVRLHELAARRAAWKTVQEPLQAEYEAAKKELEAWRANGWQLAGGNGQPGFWIRYDALGLRQPNPTPAEVAAHEKAGSAARRRFNLAKRALKERQPEGEELAHLKTEQEDEIYDLEVRRDQVRKGEAEISPKDQQLADEMAQRLREEEEEARRKAAIPPPEPPKMIDLAKSPAAKDTDGREAMALAFGPSAKATDLNSEANNYSGFHINRGKDWIADVRKDGAVPVITLRDSEEDEDRLREQAILYGTNGMPLYLRYNRKRKPIEKEAEEVRKIYEIYRTPPLEGETADAAGKRKLAELEQLGGLPRQILERARSGELSLDHGEAMMRDFYGGTLKPVDPRSSKVFQVWLDELAPDAVRESWQKSGHDVAARNAVRHQFVNWWYATNKGLPGVSHKMQARLRQELASEESEGFDENFTAIKEAGKSLVSNLTGPMLGMGLALQEHAVLTPLSWINEEAAGHNNKLRRMQGRDLRNFGRGFAKNFEKYFTNEGSQERGELMLALWHLKEVIDTPEGIADYGSSITPEQVAAARKAAMQAVRDKAYAVHARRLEKGYEIRPEDVDPELDAILKSTLAEYEATGDPAMWKVFERRLQMDRGNREYNDEMAELTEGLSEFEAAVVSGIYAGPQEAGTEVLSWAAGGLGHLGKLGKLAKVEARLASLASGGGRLGEVATQLLRGQRMLGRIGGGARASGAAEGTLTAAPAALWQRIGRAALNQSRHMAGEAGEEVFTEFGNAEMTPGSLLHAGGMGAIGAPLLKPVMRVAGMPAGIMAGWVRDVVRGKKAPEFADWHNRAMAGTPGFQELAAADAAVALEGADLAELERLAEEHNAALKELAAAEEEIQDEHRTSETGHRISNEEAGANRDEKVTAGERESRSSRIEPSVVGIQDSRVGAASSPAWDASAPAGGAKSASMAEIVVDGRARQSEGMPAVEASDGYAEGAEIDSAPLLGLEFQPWDESSEREVRHPAAGGNAAIPRAAERTFRSTLENNYGARDVRLLGLSDGAGAAGHPRLRRFLVAGLVRGFERAFGKRVIFYRAASSGRPLPRGGLMARQLPNYIAVNADGPFSLFFVLGHELGHAIERQQSGLYEATKAEVLALLRDKDSYIAREGLAQWYGADKLDNEVFNDVLGHFFRDARFWQEMGQRNGGLTARIFTVFAKVVAKMLASFHSQRGGRNAESMLADHLIQIRKRVAEMVDEYRRRGEFPPAVPEARGSISTTDAVEMLEHQAHAEGASPKADGGEPGSRGAEERSPAPPPSTAQAESPRARLDRAAARAAETAGAVSGHVMRTVEATQAAKALPPAARTRNSGLIKAANGRGDLLSRQERGAIAGLKTRQGAPYFQVRDGRTSFTPEGIAELRAEQPLIADLIADPAADVAGNSSAGVSVPETGSPASAAASNTRVSPADVAAAVMAPGARQRLGNVRAGRLHALQAYRDLSAKKAAKGSLSSAEQSKLDRAAQALSAEMRRGSSGIRRDPDVEVRGLSENPYAEPDVDDVFDNGFPPSAAHDARMSRLQDIRRQLAEAKSNQLATLDALGTVDDTAPDAQAEYARLLAEEQAAQALVDDLIEKAREALRPAAKTGRKTAFHGDLSLLDHANRGLDVTLRYLSDELIPHELEIIYHAGERGGHYDGIIFINEGLPSSRIAHEIIHELEVIHKHVLERTKAFLEKRGLSGGKGSIRDRTGDHRYASNEQAWFDLWWEKGGDEYSGKDCGPNATEILTEGIERLDRNPVLFMLTDPEYFEFVVRTLNPQ